mgnify:CR=1 FL=1
MRAFVLSLCLGSILAIAPLYASESERQKEEGQDYSTPNEDNSGNRPNSSNKPHGQDEKSGRCRSNAYEKADAEEFCEGQLQCENKTPPMKINRTGQPRRWICTCQ